MTIVIAYWILIALYQFYEVSAVTSAAFFLFLVALPVGLAGGLFALSFRFLFRENRFFFFLILPSLWVLLLEFLRELLPLLLPWGLAGYALSDWPAFIQMADITGVYGLSFLITAVNSLIYYQIRQYRWGDFTEIIKTRRFPIRLMGGFFRRQALPLSLILLLIAGPLIYGTIALGQWERSLGKPGGPKDFQAQVVQGSFGQKERWESGNFFLILETYLGLTGKGVHKQGERIVVWPETVLNTPGRIDGNLFKRSVHELGKEPLLITGGVRQDPRNRIFNSALFISGEGFLQWYDKNILLPAAETNPLKWDILGKYYEAPSEYVTGTTPSLVDTNRGRIGVSICFEVIYPWFVRQAAARGAEILVNISNDTWFGDSTMPRQHLNIARLRAVENRRYLIRASNSGLSAIISPAGEILKRSTLFARSTIESPCRRITEKSIYTILGDWILYLSLLLVTGHTAFLLWKT